MEAHLKAAAPPWQRLRLAAGAVVFLAVCWLFLPRLVSQFRPPADQVIDFYQEWSSARCVLEGRPVYEPLEDSAPRLLGIDYPADDRRHLVINAHPPTSVLLTLPFGLLDYRAAATAWNALSLTCLVVAVGVLIRTYPDEFTPTAVVMLAALLLFSFPLREQTRLGQMNLILLLLLTLTWAADRSDRQALAGFCLALATGLKLFPAVLIGYFVLRRSWRAVAHTVLWLGVLGGLSLLILGPQAYADYVAHAMPAVKEWRTHWANLSLAGLWDKLFDPGGRGRTLVPIVRSPLLARALTAASLLGVAALMSRPLREVDDEEGRTRALVLVLLALLLVSPVTWPHSLLLAVLPGALLWRRLETRRAQIGFWVCVGLLSFRRSHLDEVLLPLFSAHLPGWPATFPVYTLTVVSFPCYAVLGLLLLARFAYGRGQVSASGSWTGRAACPRGPG